MLRMLEVWWEGNSQTSAMTALLLKPLLARTDC